MAGLLLIVGSVAPDDIGPGHEARYEFTVRNDGDNDWFNIEVVFPDFSFIFLEGNNGKLFTAGEEKVYTISFAMPNEPGVIEIFTYQQFASMADLFVPDYSALSLNDTHTESIVPALDYTPDPGQVPVVPGPAVRGAIPWKWIGVAVGVVAVAGVGHVAMNSGALTRRYSTG